MTFIIATITPDAAWFSADKLRLDASTFAMPGAYDDAYTGGGGPATLDPQAAEDIEKIFALVGGSVMATGSGRAMVIATWAAMVCKATSIEDAADIRPPRADVGMIAGWSEQRGAMRGFVFAEGERIELQHGTHTMTPHPHADCASYAEIADLWQSAGRGEDVERFHRLIAANVHDAYQRGLTRPGYGVGAEILTVRADRHGLTRCE